MNHTHGYSVATEGTILNRPASWYTPKSGVDTSSNPSPVNNDDFNNPILTANLKGEIKKRALSAFDDENAFSDDVIFALEHDVADEIYQLLYLPVVEHLAQLSEEVQDEALTRRTELKLRVENGDVQTFRLKQAVRVPSFNMPLEAITLHSNDEIPSLPSYYEALEKNKETWEARRTLNENLVYMLDSAKDVRTLAERWPNGMAFVPNPRREIDDALFNSDTNKGKDDD